MLISRSGIRRIQDADDTSFSLGPASDSYAIIWDDSIGKFVLENVLGEANTTKVFNQTTASTEWIVNHGKGYYPLVQVLDSFGNQLFTEINHQSLNQFRVNLSPATAGKVIYK